MENREVDIIEAVLLNWQPKMCLEWGAGHSTIYFPKFLHKSAKWISIEHDQDWARTIKDHLQFEPWFIRRGHGECLEFYPRGQLSKIGSKTIEPVVRVLRRGAVMSHVKVFHIPPNHFPWTDEFGDGSYSDLVNHVEFPGKFGNFDFLLIDGRARKHCLIKAYEFIDNEGVVILHDANREYYREALEPYEYQVLLGDDRKSAGGVWIGSKGMNIAQNLMRPERMSCSKLKTRSKSYSTLGGRGLA